MTPTEANDFCVWQPAEGALRVVIRPRAAGRMRHETLRRAFERRGREAGGLLLGHIRHGPVRTVVIEDVEPVAWPTMMPPTDRQELEAVLKARAVSASLHSVVGYYRTQRHEGLLVNAGDLSLIRACFPDPANVFLLLKPGPGEALERRLFFWDDGIMRSSPDDDVPPWTAALAPPAEPWAPLPPAPVPAPRPRRNLLMAAIAIAAMLALLFIPSRWYAPASPQAAAPAGAPAAPDHLRMLGLEVRKSGDGLELRWDRAVPAVREALRAVLYIDDGPHRRVSELDRDQLRTGSVYYTPNTGDVRFRLEVHGLIGEPAVESVQVLAAGARQDVRASPPASASREEPEGPASPWLRHLRSLQSRYTPKAPEPRAAMVADAPPRLGGAEPFPVPASVPGALAPPPAAPPEPPPPPRRDSPPPRTDPAPPPRQVVHVPPRAVFRVNPVILPPVRAMLRGDAVVGVLVEIDAGGKVTSAEVATRQGPVNNALTESALAAARQWRFQPATADGNPVPGSVILNFRFTR